MIAVVGVGPGSREYLLPAAEEAVRAAHVLVGGRNALALFDCPGKEQRLIEGDLDGILEYIDAARQTRRVAVLLSGDPGFFSLLPRLRQRFGADGIAVIPGVSSLQLACARLGIKWDDLAVASVHGRGPEGLAAIASAAPAQVPFGCGTRVRAAVLTGPKFPPGAVCRYLLEQGSNFLQAWVLTDLGLPGEKISSGSLEAMAGLQGGGNSILILSRDEPGPEQLREPVGGEPVGGKPAGAGGASGTDGSAGVPGRAAVPGESPVGDYLEVITPGLPDKLFVQGDAAISQEEVRALTLCKAHLKRGLTVYEIGAGTGSWTVEAARLVTPGVVWAVERNPGAAALVRANVRQFGVDNVSLVEGSAPEACRGWPPADRVLIGGSGGRLPEILEAAGRWLRPRGRLVITAVTPETFSSAWRLLQEEPWVEPDTVLINVSRVAARGSARIWSGENPVFILSASLKA